MSKNQEEQWFQEKEAKDNLVEALGAYHVTNIKETDKEKGYEYLKQVVADDKVYDGPLVGLSGVFLTTNVYNRGLPDETMYPRNGNVGTNYKRYLVSYFDISNFHLLFKLNNYKLRFH